MIRCLATAIVVALLLLFAAAPVRAADPPTRHPPLAQALKGDARVLYDAARDLFKAADYVSAYAKFQRAHELSNDPRLLWNIAACERKMKHNANVLRLIDTYLREGEGWLSEDDKKEASRAAAAVRVFVAAASVKTEPADGVEIFVDDVRIASTPIDKPLWIDMGTHRVRFAKTGFRTVERTEEIPAGSELSWSVDLERAVAASSATPPPPVVAPPPAKSPPPNSEQPTPPASAPQTRSRIGPIVLSGAGLAVAATGGVLVFITSREFSSLREECGTSCERSRWTQHRTMQLVGDALLIAGGAALAVGLVWWIALPSSSATAPRAYVAPTLNGAVSGIVF